MRLVTLEGLPKMCGDVLNVLHKNKRVLVLPSPLIPLSTSVQVTPADDVCMVLANVITRLKILQRMNSASSPVVCGGCHWIESPPIHMLGRAILHRLTQDLTRAIVDEFELAIEQHMLIIMKASVHECFEHLLCKMEARDYTLNNLLDENTFLETLVRVPGVMSAFPYTIRTVSCPPFMRDNAHDLDMVAKQILQIIAETTQP